MRVGFEDPVEEKGWLQVQMACEMDGQLPPWQKEDEIHTRWSSKEEALELRDNLTGQENDCV